MIWKHLLYFSRSEKLQGVFSLENKASKYIPGLGTEFRIAAEEINMDDIKKEIDSDIGNIDAYTKEEVDSKLGLKANTADVYKKTEVDTKLGTKANTADVYKKTEVDTKLSSKANTADVYAKTETYTKAEVDKLINDLRTELSGGGGA